MENNNNNIPENDPVFDLPGKLNPGKRTIFQTPDNYFEKLPIQITDKIQALSESSVKSSNTSLRSLFSIPKLITYTAIIACVVLGSIWMLNNKEPNKQTISSLTFEDILDTSYLSPTDERILFDAYVVSGGVQSDDEVTDKDLEIKDYQDYIIENHTDINLIINEL